MSDGRIEALRRGLREKHDSVSKDDINSHQYFTIMAEEAVRILEEYYGPARYWMAAEFEREKVLRELEATIDRIRNAGISS